MFCSWVVSRASATWMESWQGTLRSPCLPDGDRGPQHLDYVSISEGQLRRRGFKRAEHFQREGFQIVNGFPSDIYRIRSRIIERIDVLTAQPPVPFFFFRPEANTTSCCENPRPLRKQFESVGYLVANEVHAQIGGNPMHVHKLNIDLLTAANSLPSRRQPLLRNVPTEKNMQMRISVFLKFEHIDEGKGTFELPRELAAGGKAFGEILRPFLSK